MPVPELAAPGIAEGRAGVVFNLAGERYRLVAMDRLPDRDDVHPRIGTHRQYDARTRRRSAQARSNEQSWTSNPSRTRADYRAALKAVESLQWAAKARTPEGDRLEVLADADRGLRAPALPDGPVRIAVEAIKFRHGAAGSDAQGPGAAASAAATASTKCSTASAGLTLAMIQSASSTRGWVFRPRACCGSLRRRRGGALTQAASLRPLAQHCASSTRASRTTQAGATQSPDFPPRFSSTRTSPITMPRSAALHMS